MLLSACGKSEIGKVRPTNEDRFVMDHQVGLYLVCDGMGGHAAGEVAAEMTAEGIREHLRVHSDLLQAVSEGRRPLHVAQDLAFQAVQQVAADVYDASVEHAEFRGMGTTLTMLLVLGDQALIFHAGDSRLYRIRGGRVSCLTWDHTVAEELARQGYDLAGVMSDPRLSNMLTRCIGRTRHVEAESLVIRLQPQDRLILCSDGFSRYISSDEELGELLGRHTPQEMVEAAISRALNAGGADNVTVLALQVQTPVPSSPYTGLGVGLPDTPEANEPTDLLWPHSGNSLHWGEITH